MDIHTAMHDRRIVYFFTFYILNTTEVVQHHALIYVVLCKLFIVLAIRPEDGS